MKALARITDPATSHAAAESVKVTDMEARILTDLEIHGGSTCKEIAARLNCGRDSVSPRMKRLLSAGRITEGGRRDKQTVYHLYRGNQ